ncbi:hypothetical protein M2311_005692 [Rhizobium leguminosarum]|uniref:DUF4435 domain-containing protein n=2 Tax=Rhizobium TaxID=379 RepID=UPI002472F53D|nr:DUF4435 domain-containing protein [Rhizobium leguminosarum]MDH6275592.1 hypothetical protein [Rhizobium leguminosarum]
MLTISRHMNGRMIARQIRMERQVDKRSAIMLVEGGTDVKRFKRFVDEAACIQVNAWGKENAVTAMEILKERSPAGLLAVVDADFDRIQGKLANDARVIYSESHDFDLDWMFEDLLAHYLEEVADPNKVAAAGGVAHIIQKILDGLRPISAARLLNTEKKIPFKVSHLDAGDYFDKFAVDIDQYLADLTKDSEISAEEYAALGSLIASTANRNFDLKQLTNGHDFYSALGASLRGDIGDRKQAQTFGNECEIHIRLSFTPEIFKQTLLYTNLIAWEQANPRHSVLKPELTPPAADSQAA